MKLQPVKIFRPDADGNLQLVEVISQKEVTRLADKKLNKKKRKVNARKNKRK